MSIAEQQSQHREIPIPVKEWLGMISDYPSKSIPTNSFQLARNVRFVGGNFKVETRPGSIEYIGNAVTGSGNKVVGGFEFKKTDGVVSYILEVTSDGKLYSTLTSLGGTPTLIGSLTNTNVTQVGFAQLADAVYIADGIDPFKWDGTTLTNIRSTFPSIAPLSTGNIIDVIATRSQIFWGGAYDYLYASAFNLPDDLTTTSAGAYKIQIQYGDGARLQNIVPWGDTVLINKADPVRDQYVMYWLKGLGTTTDPYFVKQLFGDPKSPTSFIGRSAVQIGGDIIGLTLDGITSVSAINNFQEAAQALVSSPINDYIQRINFNAQDKIHGVFDLANRNYMLAVPLDGQTEVTHILVYDVTGDRWSYYDNWDVNCWVRVGSEILFGTTNGRLVKVNYGHNDEGAGFVKDIKSGDRDHGAPDIIKLFKCTEVNIKHEGDYNVKYFYGIDGTEINTNNPILLGLSGDDISLWDEFIWDEDYWDGDGNTLKNIPIQGRGKTISHRFYNDQVDQPFTLVDQTDRIVIKDAGQAKS